MLARAEVRHDPLVDLAGEEAFEAPDDLASGPAVSGASCDVVNSRLVEPHPDDDSAIEGGVGLSVATAHRHPSVSQNDLDRQGYHAHSQVDEKLGSVST